MSHGMRRPTEPSRAEQNRTDRTEQNRTRWTGDVRPTSHSLQQPSILATVRRGLRAVAGTRPHRMTTVTASIRSSIDADGTVTVSRARHWKNCTTFNQSCIIVNDTASSYSAVHGCVSWAAVVGCGDVRRMATGQECEQSHSHARILLLFSLATTR